jgi:hypothetical protein
MTRTTRKKRYRKIERNQRRLNPAPKETPVEEASRVGEEFVFGVVRLINWFRS